MLDSTRSVLVEGLIAPSFSMRCTSISKNSCSCRSSGRCFLLQGLGSTRQGSLTPLRVQDAASDDKSRQRRQRRRRQHAERWSCWGMSSGAWSGAEAASLRASEDGRGLIRPPSGRFPNCGRCCCGSHRDHLAGKNRVHHVATHHFRVPCRSCRGRSVRIGDRRCLGDGQS
jgi:hypothetical protein